jgi:hypothetical protein
VKGLALALGLSIAAFAGACGDDEQAQPDGSVDPIDAPVDAPPATATFTSFTIDLIANQTANTTEPKPFADFSALPDPDQDNATAYASLF